MLSVITNFGCDECCLYCVMKGHKFEHVRTTVESTCWSTLFQLTLEHLHISVSGGGDPLFQLDKNMDWWKRFFETVGFAKKIDIHTAKLAPKKFAQKFHKYVWHVKDIAKPLEAEYQQLAAYKIPVRVVAIGEERYSESDYLNFAQQATERGFQCSIRELVVNGKPCAENKTLTTFLESEQGWKFIRQADYNTYFMPDNKVYDKFLQTGD